jgi:hypothetical protein
VRRGLCNVLGIEQDLAFLRAVEAVDAVEQAGLTGAVRADDGQNFSFLRQGKGPVLLI